MELEVEFHGMGISLVDDDPIRREIVYLSVTGSGAHWESRPKHKQKYKTLSTDLSTQVRLIRMYSTVSVSVQSLAKAEISIVIIHQNKHHLE